MDAIYQTLTNQIKEFINTNKSQKQKEIIALFSEKTAPLLFENFIFQNSDVQLQPKYTYIILTSTSGEKEFIDAASFIYRFVSAFIFNHYYSQKHKENSIYFSAISNLKIEHNSMVETWKNEAIIHIKENYQQIYSLNII